MKQKLHILFLFLIISISSFAQVANQPSDLIVCDGDNDGLEMFDLSVLDFEVIGSQNPTGFVITYHETLSDANNQVNALPIPYSNIVPWVQTIYVRLEDSFTGIFDVVSVNLIINPVPYAVQPTSLNLCDEVGDIYDEITVFDLTVKDMEITNGNTDWSVTYYETYDEAQAQTNGITNPTAYSNRSINGQGANPQTLFVVVTDINTGCVDFVTLTLRVLPNPSGIMGSLNAIELCDEQSNGTATFDLTYNEGSINPSGEPYEISYFLNEVDAYNNSTPIINPNNFTNTNNPQTIFVRVETLAGCFAVLDFDIIVNSLPEIYLESSYSFCEGESIIIDTDLATSNFNYSWTFNGASLPNETQSSLMVTQSGNYTVYVSDFNMGCTNVYAFEVLEVSCTDTDSDGVIDSEEDLNNNGNLEDDDTDNDGIPNFLDDDDDGDNVDTNVEINIAVGRSSMHQFVDTDNDLIENYLDDDDDGDNVLTVDEDYNNNDDPTDDDTNNNTIPDYLESAVALGFNEFSKVTFSLFPNPANNEVTIQLANSNIPSVKVNIYNLQGKSILSDFMLSENNPTLNISHLDRGLYFVEIVTKSVSSVQKLIVN
ncbi:T9SS type A sorting domain-containing protein [Winogradskyella bathintestinalis]|uniref:T9SS type A sorting domain-containing protein n=1 Tax=Winogradskyella bathintestinalis TaxID=3035208 RepID=A0ABT7ZWP0_9FLAO|nr:T9SS type A sorting domain-containing protein [Winogradskyella bathintestinalis]MDN3493408.1 T9SS type A sorting domain-containing protein [Winogradskyella bathintestinalis]